METPWYRLDMHIESTHRKNRVGLIQRISFTIATAIIYCSQRGNTALPERLGEYWKGMERWEDQGPLDARNFREIDAELKEGLDFLSTDTLATTLETAFESEALLVVEGRHKGSFDALVGCALADLLMSADANPNYSTRRYKEVMREGMREGRPDFNGGYLYRIEDVDDNIIDAWNRSIPYFDGYVPRGTVDLGMLERTQEYEDAPWRLYTAIPHPVPVGSLPGAEPYEIINAWHNAGCLEIYDLTEGEAWAWWSVNGGPTATPLSLDVVDFFTPVGTYCDSVGDASRATGK